VIAVTNWQRDGGHHWEWIRTHPDRNVGSYHARHGGWADVVASMTSVTGPMSESGATGEDGKSAVVIVATNWQHDDEHHDD
jgi:hypothetical protein